ncbi:hypothetical protein [Paraburkholderia ginsengisoli]|uniref:Uncharacterized protein n=1 Tax=Paraburkholderia ginsengisoli TaxID=311231 RepID=A0A7T4T9F3_9BURK|nr:hypothetical protein I6I06_02155 [Paraburkholderia ginsengisoli]
MFIGDRDQRLVVALAFVKLSDPRFVAIKSVEQQAILAWHSVRAGWQEERTALLNRTRGLLAEFGVVIARSADRLLAAWPGLVDDARLHGWLAGRDGDRLGIGRIVLAAEPERFDELGRDEASVSTRAVP